MKKSIVICNKCFISQHGELLRTSAGYFYYFNKKYNVPYTRKEINNTQCRYCSDYTWYKYIEIPLDGRDGLYITDSGWQPPLPGMEFVGSYKVE